MCIHRTEGPSCRLTTVICKADGTEAVPRAKVEVRCSIRVRITRLDVLEALDARAGEKRSQQLARATSRTFVGWASADGGSQTVGTEGLLRAAAQLVSPQCEKDDARHGHGHHEGEQLRREKELEELAVRGQRM